MFKHPSFGRAVPPDPIYSVYQPIIRIETGEIMGYEALIRGTGKNKQAEQLFRIAYEQGYAIPFDLKCLETSFGILSQLSDRQLLFVNVEPMTLGYAFRERREAERILKKNRTYLKQIVFELTEGMMLRDFDFVKSGFLFLRRMKCQCAIDDVAGMGTKILKLLSLRPDFIKIDMSLVQGIADNPMQQQLMDQLLDLGQKHHADIIAEGIERKSDLEWVKKLKIPYGQGYCFGEPQRLLRNAVREYE